MLRPVPEATTTCVLSIMQVAQAPAEVLERVGQKDLALEAREDRIQLEEEHRE